VYGNQEGSGLENAELMEVYLTIPSVLAQTGPSRPDERLTSREREVLDWTARGKTAFEISIILSISERTVNFHVNNLKVKLASPTKILAVLRAKEAGIL
jgi:DNA-binding CsgD family transcriptional regulator